MIVLVSQLLHFASQHPIWFLVIVLAGSGVIGLGVQLLRGGMIGYCLVPVALVLGIVNIPAGHWLNAAFINGVGTAGTGIMVTQRDANFLLNDAPVSHYDTVLTTADGMQILTSVTEMSAAIYPLRNAILIPPLNQAFVTKYVPGHAVNFVIMSDESDYGKRRLLSEAREPVERMRSIYAVSPANADFVRQYRAALEDFLAKHTDLAPADLLADYRAALEALKGEI